MILFGCSDGHQEGQDEKKLEMFEKNTKNCSKIREKMRANEESTNLAHSG